MADPSTCLPLTPSSITDAHAKISKHIHRTPLLTSKTLDEIASSPNPWAYLNSNPPTSHSDPTPTTNGDAATTPKFRLYFKCENFQKIGAFKSRGAFHALSHLISSLGIDEVKRRGVITHSSGNHAQALVYAASIFDVPAWIVMPTISTPSKIQGTMRYAGSDKVIFSGSRSEEREAKVREVQKEKGAVLVPPYDHPDIVLGQGTAGKEMDEQFQDQELAERSLGTGGKKDLDAVIAPLGGGGLLAGIATWFSDKDTLVFGAEPEFQGADDARRGLEQGKRIESVSTLTIADGLRTPVGIVNWGVIAGTGKGKGGDNDKRKVERVYSVTEREIKMAMRLVFERMKVVVEPSGCVPLAVVLFNEEFRRMVAEKQREKLKEDGEGEVWDVGVVFSGGNTTMKAISGLFTNEEEKQGEEVEREEGKVGMDGERKAENVAG